MTFFWGVLGSFLDCFWFVSGLILDCFWIALGLVSDRFGSVLFLLFCGCLGSVCCFLCC